MIHEIREELLSGDAYSVYAACMYRPTLEKYLSLAGLWLHKPDVHCFGSFDGKSINGLLVIDDQEILGIAIAPAARGRGIGRTLILYASESLSLSRLTAETDSDAVGFYLACGFECTKTERDFPDGAAIRYNCIKKFF